VTTLLAAMADSPAAATQVEPGDFASTAHAFADEQATLVRSGLAANTPCIGQDASATYFAGYYGDAGETVMNGIVALVTLVGSIAQGLARSGTDHGRADAISAANWRTTDYETITVDTWDSTNAQVVPTITGYDPGWLPGILNGFWPCRDDDKLAGCVVAWRGAQQSLNGLRDRLHSALTALVDNNHGPDLDELESFWAEFVSGPEAIFPAMDAAIGAVISGLDAYGEMIDSLRSPPQRRTLSSEGSMLARNRCRTAPFRRRRDCRAVHHDLATVLGVTLDLK
jgi:hypothetical protein